MRIERGDQRRRLRHHPRRPPLPLAVDPGRSLPALQKRPPRLCEIAERAGAKATGRRVRRLRRSGCRPPSALRQPRRDRLSGSAPWSRSIQPQDTGRRAASAAQPFSSIWRAGRSLMRETACAPRSAQSADAPADRASVDRGAAIRASAGARQRRFRALPAPPRRGRARPLPEQCHRV